MISAGRSGVGDLPLNEACAGARFTYLCQAGTEQFEQRSEFALLPNRLFGALAVTVLVFFATSPLTNIPRLLASPRCSDST